MSDLGGFFAVSYLAERVLLEGLDAAWKVRWRDAAGLAGWATDTPVGRLEVSGAVSLNKPQLALSGAANAVQLSLSAVARLDLMLDGIQAGGVFIEAAAHVDVPVRVTHEGGFHKAVVDLTGIVLQEAQLRLTWYRSPPGGRSVTAVLSPEARQALTAQFVRRAQPYLTFRLPTDEIWLAELTAMTKGNPGSIIFMPFIKIGGVRILDGWLALGLDATSSIGESHGDPALIGPPPDAPTPLPHSGLAAEETGDGTLRLILDPALVLAYLTANAKFALRLATVARPDIHPSEDITIRLEDDSVVVNAGGTVDAPDPFSGTMPFTADLRVRPFIAKNTRTVYASVSPNIRVDAPWYLDVIGGIADFFGIDVFAKLRRANQSMLAVLFGVKAEEKIPDMGDMHGRIEGRRIVLRPNLVAIFGEAQLKSWWSGPDALTPRVIDGVPIRKQFLQLKLNPLYSNPLLTDPTYRINYRIRRGSNGTQVDAGAGWSGPDPFGGPIDLWDSLNYLETEFNVDLSVERPPGREVARHSQKVKVLDLFDRAHPYVRWRKTHHYTGGRSKIRLSAVHRTAIRERCQFCDAGTQRDRSTYVIQSLDSIPAPQEDGFSNELCPYCFPPH